MSEFTKEPIIHSHITDGLPYEHPLADVSVLCDKCAVIVHSFNNECMQTWYETEFGNYCTSCFGFDEVIESLEHCLARKAGR